MTRKLLLSIIIGFLYWLITYGTTNLFVIMDLAYSDNVGTLLYFVIPFILGCALIIWNQERKLIGVAYSTIIIITRYAITFIEIAIRYPSGPSAFEQTLFAFTIIGGYSMFCAIVGGILGLYLNKKYIRKL